MPRTEIPHAIQRTIVVARAWVVPGSLWLMSLRGRQELEFGDHEYLPRGAA